MGNVAFDYLIGLINSTINMFIQIIVSKPEKKTDHGLNTQSDSISAKLFVYLVPYFYVTFFLMNFFFCICIMFILFFFFFFYLIMTSENVETSCIF